MKGPDLKDEHGASSRGELGLDMLLRQLQTDSGLNFKQYKPNYLKRRIGVRMRALGCGDYRQYRQYVRQDPDEGRRLINDLTINVTEFFRDADVYEAIRKSVVPELIRHKKESRIYTLRAWSAGCATGEEAYSLSILFLSELAKEENAGKWSVRITASDLDDKALAKARAGIYDNAKTPSGLVLDDYFSREGSRYAVREEVRRPVKFMLMDIMKSPPLRHLDLILCRNLLIYFERERQLQIMDIFQRCLRPGGFLVLGKSEAVIGTTGSGFTPFSRRERIYRKEGEPSRETASGSAGGR